VVNPTLGVADVKGLIALAKQKPDELLYGASGLGSGPHVATELFKQMASVKMTGVLYPGSGQTAVDLIAGRIQVMFAPAPTVLGLIKDGRVKPLATTEAKRSNIAPDLPTVAEAALPGYAAGLWFGILGPGGLPKPAIDKLSEATNAALKDPTVLQGLQSQGLNAAGGSPADFVRFIVSDTERWARVIKSMDAVKKTETAIKP
jgi:tripartite-type tricarboxylate transporter receptor subunit TctC